ncbi:MAG TPA: hypothetical protein VI911_00980 [Patescibacteria group bacterium]|nr:hypothetical protein [Patescibacteria group bacterium]
MGSFNVACSISNVSINAGQRIAFIPLVIKRHLAKDGKLPIPNQMLIEPDSLLTPFCLPIFGKYNDYGSIEHIEKDANTEAIEAYMGMPIESFVDCITCGREPHDYFGDLFKHFATNGTRGVVRDYRVHFDGKYLEQVGFKRLDIPGEAWYDYIYEDFPYLVKLIAGYDQRPIYPNNGHRIMGIGFEVYDHTGSVVYTGSHYDAKSALPKAFLALTDYFIYVNKEDQEKVKLLKSMSGMFIHSDIWDYMINMPGREKELFNLSFDELQQKIIAYDNGEEDYFTHTVPSVEKQLTEHNMLCAILEKVEDFVPNQPGSTLKISQPFFVDPIKAVVTENYFHRFFNNWPYFAPVYRAAIKDDSIKEYFMNYCSFYWEMYSTNRFFFPGMNGEQSGNTEASLRLARQTVKLLEERQKEENE